MLYSNITRTCAHVLGIAQVMACTVVESVRIQKQHDMKMYDTSVANSCT
jgi:hypothetical protein